MYCAPKMLKPRRLGNRRHSKFFPQCGMGLKGFAVPASSHYVAKHPARGGVAAR